MCNNRGRKVKTTIKLSDVKVLHLLESGRLPKTWGSKFRCRGEVSAGILIPWRKKSSFQLMYQAHGCGKLTSTMSGRKLTAFLPVVWQTAILSQALSGWQAPVLNQLGLVQRTKACVTGHRGGALERRAVKWNRRREKPEVTGGQKKSLMDECVGVYVLGKWVVWDKEC